MLNLYLPYQRQPRRQPSAGELARWLRALSVSELIAPLSAEQLTLLERCEALSQAQASAPLPSELINAERPLRLNPGLGVSALFDQDAREQLLPAELTFEQLRLELAPHPTFLPLATEELELEVSCRGCGDLVPPERFERALRSLQLIPLERMRVRCPSCDEERSHKELSFEREVAFASAWLTLEQCGSGRLNPTLLKAWGDALGAPLCVVSEQTEARLDWAGGDEQTWAGAEGLGPLSGWGEGAPSFFELGVKPSRALRGARQPKHTGKGRAGKGRRGGGDPSKNPFKKRLGRGDDEW